MPFLRSAGVNYSATNCKCFFAPPPSATQSTSAPLAACARIDKAMDEAFKVAQTERDAMRTTRPGRESCAPGSKSKAPFVAENGCPKKHQFVPPLQTREITGGSSGESVGWPTTFVPLVKPCHGPVRAATQALWSWRSEHLTRSPTDEGVRNAVSARCSIS